jgi:hypothetical protein
MITNVTVQLANVTPKNLQFTPDCPSRQPTPTMPPTMHCGEGGREGGRERGNKEVRNQV